VSTDQQRQEKNDDAWLSLAGDYERARAREDSLDLLVEWPAQRAALGDVSGRSVLDIGCGDGSKLAELVRAGAVDSVGIDVRDDLLSDTPNGMTLARGDISSLSEVSEIRGRRFDRILFLQSFGYASDPVATLQAARELLTDDGFILLTRTQPVRYALERAEQNGTSLGEEYFASGSHTYSTGWNDQIALTKRTYTMSDLLNTFSDAGLRIERTWEPQLSPADAERYPHKAAWMNAYLGILIFRLRPLP